MERGEDGFREGEAAVNEGKTGERGGGERFQFGGGGQQPLWGVRILRGVGAQKEGGNERGKKTEGRGRWATVGRRDRWRGRRKRGGSAALCVSSCAPAQRCGTAQYRRWTGQRTGPCTATSRASGARHHVPRRPRAPRRYKRAAHPPLKRDTALCWPPALPSASSGGPVSGRGAQARPLQQLTLVLAVVLALEL